jgi:formiminoglutamase
VADRVVRPVAVVLGAPFAGGSLSRARCDEAPAAIRAALARFSAYSSDTGVTLEIGSVLDAGDVDPAADVEETQARVAEAAAAILDRAQLPIVLLGGDNSVTVGGARGARADSLLTFDAHHDVRDGSSNGSPVRQLLQDGIEGSRVVQIGIHGFANSAEYTERARKAGISWISPAEVRARGMGDVVEEALQRLAYAGASRVWVDVDLDCLDRAFAPGTAGAMPGGLWPADLERAAFACGRSQLVAGLDVTELDPATDVGEVTARTGCAVMLSFLCGVVAR